MSEALKAFFGVSGVLVWFVLAGLALVSVVRWLFKPRSKPIPGPRIKITPELRDRAVAIQQDKET